MEIGISCFLNSQGIDANSIIEAVPDAIVIIDASGKIVYSNHQAEKIFGYDRNEVIEKNLDYLMPVRYRDGYSTRLIEYLSGSSLRPTGGLELFGLKKDGTEFPVEVGISPLKKENPFLAIIVIRDISSQKTIAEELYIKNMELREVNLAKDQFLASMSHELRTPLNAIIGFAGTLLMKLPGPLTTAQEKQLRTIESSAKMLIYLIDDILDLAKIDSGKVTVNLEKINCNEVINEVVATLSILAESKKIELRCDIPAIETYVMTDRRSLMQIIINLLNNAIKYTDQGYVEIKSSVVTIDNNEFVRIDVTDTGIGIKEESKGRLFRQFERLEAEGKFHDGTGLGLYVSKKLAALINAKIEFQSEYGKGSLFSVLISNNSIESVK